MMTVHEVSELTGVSIRTLQYYDKIGLLRPAQYTEAGYRLYDNDALETLQQILLFRELEFPLKDIKTIIQSPNFDREKALEQQIELLTMKMEHIDHLITLAKKIKAEGGTEMSFQEFDKKKLEEYAAKAKASWGHTDAYKEYEEKSKGRTEETQQDLNERMMAIFDDFGKMKDQDPAGEEAQTLVGKLQSFITENYYHCTKEILAGLGQAYGCGGEFTENINKHAGEGAAEFAAAAIEVFCR
ncbi:MAG: MerR family transcriptional regulator [Lachnospiraceae bacterium]|nr:MerR family transcriptional regulator [Lachnospiraceae bacterium]